MTMPRNGAAQFMSVPIVGGIANLRQIVLEKQAEEIFVCIPSATLVQMRRHSRRVPEVQYSSSNVALLAEMADGGNAGIVSPRNLRSPRIEDLLQREEMRVDAEETRQAVGGKVVLVTGAGGSIGSELCRQIASARPRKLLLLDKSENSLFYIDLEIRNAWAPR